MEANINIILPVHPAIFGIFLAILVVSLVVAGIKYVLTIVLGG